jgi:hypothetical protein
MLFQYIPAAYQIVCVDIQLPLAGLMFLIPP